MPDIINTLDSVNALKVIYKISYLCIGNLPEFWANADKSNNILAKGISNYSSSEISKIQGMESSLVLSIFGPESKKEVIHANNLVILKEEF